LYFRDKKKTKGFLPGVYWSSINLDEDKLGFSIAGVITYNSKVNLGFLNEKLVAFKAILRK